MTIEINMPDIGADEAEITEILVKEGDKIEIEQSLISVEGEKTSLEVPAPRDGIVKEIKVSVGDKIKPGELIMILNSVEGKSAVPVRTEEEKKEVISSISDMVKSEDKSMFEENDAYVHATPLIRRLAREFSINLTKVTGTGYKGRILREDIQTYVKSAIARAETPKTSWYGTSLNLLPWPKVNFERFGETEKIELSRIQKLSGGNLSRNWIMIPHVTHFDKADITDLEIFRKQQNNEAKKKNLGIKITLVSFIMKAVVVALEKMPRFNSSLSEDGQHLILKKYVNIGIAVDTPNGLVVPVFRDVKKKGIIELSNELVSFRKKAFDGKLTSEEIQGGCFTISSIGGLGTTYFIPIVNAPEVSILGVSKASIEPVWNGKNFSPRLVLPLSLSFDHRVIDGADGARFISIIKNALGDIRCLIM